MKKAIVIGAGFSGMTAAVSLADAGYSVEIYEARDHLGGNAADKIDRVTGVRYHRYGPHFFHTNSDKVFNFLSRFTDWIPYTHRVRSKVNDNLVDFPINLNTLRAMFPVGVGTSQHAHDLIKALGQESIRAKTKKESMDSVMCGLIGDYLFDTFYKGYSEKQWGKPTTELPAPIAKRIPIRFDYKNTYFEDKYQCLPKDGYTSIFWEMTSHPNITKVERSRMVEPWEVKSWATSRDLVVYTGPIDALFDHHYGKLEYRSLKFVSIDSDEPRTDVVINYPSADVAYTRETEFGLLPNNPAPSKSFILRELPSDNGEPYYPLPDEANKSLYKQYRKLADSYKNLLLIGRLAEYRYYNMDQAVASALSKVSKRI